MGSSWFHLRFQVGRRPPQQRAGRVSPLPQICRVPAPQVNDAIAVAAQPFEVAGNRAFVLGEGQQHAIRKVRFKARSLAANGHRAFLLRVETAVHQAGRRACGGRAAGHCVRMLGVRQRQSAGMQVNADDAHVQVGELRRHARVELNHAEPVRGLVLEKLHVEHAVGETNGREKSLCHL